MSTFQIALSNVLLTLLYIAPGYAACKLKKASADHLPTLSAVLIYICSPCLIVTSFLNMDFSWDILGQMGLFFLVTLMLQSAFMAILYGLIHGKYDDARYRILTIAAVMGNVGFFGKPIVEALLPDHPEAVCFSAIFSASMNVLVFTMGIFCLTRKKEYMTVKAAIVNPASLSLYVALPLFILGARHHIPEMLLNSMRLLGNMTTPLCMFILGIRLATVPWKTLLLRPFVYGISLCKLVAFPLFGFGIVSLLPLPAAFKASVLILSATPCASIILSLAEIHHSEMELSANCVLVSTLICFLTIPLLTLLL
ncbi:MAG: AEC family transporter [Clostridia bacterium]|nr:AEC family transporter [Clostridia bacterium]